MKKILIDAYELASVFTDVGEVSGSLDNPAIMMMLQLDNAWPQHDEVPWCSAFVNYICKLLKLPRSHSLLARSWLTVGEAVSLDDAEIGFDIVVITRGGDNEPGKENLTAPGHVGFYAGNKDGRVFILGGNQGDKVNLSSFDVSRILDIRRLHE